MAIFTIIVNGKNHTVDVEPDMPLVWVLRDFAGLKGTKYGCGVAACGACTIHLDGNPVRSCQLRISDVLSNGGITTVEGVAGEGLHVVQQAWIDQQVPQCGYCQSGQIMSAIALLTRNRQPTDRDIDAALSGNICRCGTYDRIRKAIHQAARMMQETNGNKN